MKINGSNSLLTSRNLASTSQAISRALQRLSTGKRVNSPKDGVVAFADGVRMDAQVRGLSQAIKNINSAQGILQTANSSISTMLEITYRMREISLESANGSLSYLERQSLNSEFRQLIEHYDQTLQSAKFEGISLLDGSFGSKTVQVGHDQGDTVTLQIDSARAQNVFQATVADEAILEATGTFSFGATISTNNSFGKDMRIVDLDDDGDLDLLQTNGALIEVFLNNGDGSFTLTHTQASPGNGNAPSLTDFNGDGNLDFVVSGPFSYDLSVFLGDGAGSFSAGVVLSQGPQVYSSATLADFNGDGEMDIAVADNGLAQVSIYLSNGDGTFSQQTTLTGISTFDESPVAVDINNDEVLDLLVTNNASKRVSVFIGDGDGTFTQTLTLTVGDNPTPISTGDLNGDGNIDLVITNEDDNNTSIFLGNGDGTFAVGQTLSAGSNTMVPATLGYIDGDEHLDLVITNRSAPGKVNILLGNGDGTFTYAETLTTGSIPHEPILQDIDLDGNADLVVGSNNEMQIFYGNGDGTFASAVTVSVGNFLSITTGADLNGDGFLDIISDSTGSDEITILLADTELIAGNTELVFGDLDVTTQVHAENSLALIDAGIESLTQMQAGIGSQIHRLDHTRVANLLRSEAITNSRENILSTDFSLEVAELVRNQILESAQTSVLTQANVQMQMVLNLLAFD